MHYLIGVDYEKDYRLLLRFEDGSLRRVDLMGHLEGKVFEPLKRLTAFRTARLNTDIDTVVWDNGADMSPDFLYSISTPAADAHRQKVAEGPSSYC